MIAPSLDSVKQRAIVEEYKKLAILYAAPCGEDGTPKRRLTSEGESVVKES